MVAAIHVVALFGSCIEAFLGQQANEAYQKDVLGVWHLAAHAKQLHHVIELAMYVATDRHGRRDWHDVWFFQQHRL